MENTSRWEVAAEHMGKPQGWAGMLLPNKNQPEGDQPNPLSSSQPACTEGTETEQLGKGRGSNGGSSPASFCGSFQQSQGQSAADF